MSIAVLGRDALDAILDVVRARSGLALPPVRRSAADAGVRRVMARLDVGDMGALVDLVQRSAAVFDDVVAELTIGETYFLRDRAQLDLVRSEALPDILGRAGPRQPVRVWSAGCSTGEEAYTLAITLDQAGALGRASILGSDISRPALARAEAALYGPWSLRGVERAVVERYFRAEENRFRVIERLRRPVSFAYVNLAARGDGPAAMDLVLCRNVLLYFEPEAVERAAARLLGALAPGGWLLTGPSDPLLPCEPPFERILGPAGAVYRRALAWAQPQSAPQPSAPQPSAPQPSTPQPQGAPLEATPATPGVASALCTEAALSAPAPAAESAPANDAPEPVDPLAPARAAFAAGDYGRAADLAAEIAGPGAAMLSVRARANRDGTEQAIALAADAARRFPLSAELHYLHAVLLFDAGRSGDAIAAIRRALYLDRSLAAAHYLLGTLLARIGDAAGARRAHRTAAALAEGRAR